MSNLPDPSTTPAGAPLLPEERVHAALRRAAQLQAEAAERLEGDVRARIAPQAGDAGEPGFRREDVEAAAVQAGISPEYIQQALVEQDTLGDHAAELAPWMDRMANRMLRTRQRSIELSRTVDAEPRAVLDAMQRVFPAQPYGLMLVDCVGPAPLEGGVLVFDIPRLSASGYTSFSYTAAVVDLLQLHATLHPVPAGERNRCTVTLRGDLRTSARRNVWAGIGLSGVGGTVGGLIGGAVAGIASGGVIPLLAAGVALGAAGFGGATGVGYGAVYRHYLRKMIRELETLLKVVDTNARTGGGFGAPQLPAAKRGDADGMAGLLGSL